MLNRLEEYVSTSNVSKMEKRIETGIKIIETIFKYYNVYSTRTRSSFVLVTDINNKYVMYICNKYVDMFLYTMRMQCKLVYV